MICYAPYALGGAPSKILDHLPLFTLRQFAELNLEIIRQIAYRVNSHLLHHHFSQIVMRHTSKEPLQWGRIVFSLV